MDAATLIERIDRQIQEQEPVFAALREALSSCDPGLQFALPRTALHDPEPSCATPALLPWNQHTAALYGAV